jgi:hypothetical protein
MEAAPFISQTGQTRCAVQGELVNGGGTCTVVLIRESTGWVFYPHGATGMAVRIAEPDAETVAATILDHHR